MNARSRRTLLVALAMLAPNFIGFLVFTAGPVVFSLVMAFTNWNLTIHNNYSAEKVMFVGIDNFRALLGGEEWRYFSKYFVNTVYLMLIIPFDIALSLIAALMLNASIETLGEGRKGATVGSIAIITLLGAGALCVAGLPPFAVFMMILTGAIVVLGLVLGQTGFRTIFYLPSLTSGVATFILWKALYRPETGPVNRALRPQLAALSAAVAHTPAVLWQALGWVLIIGSLICLMWFSVSMVKKYFFKDIGIAGLIFSLLGMAALAAMVCGIGYCFARLPMAIHPAGGALNVLEPPKWLVDTAWSKPAIMIMAIFMAIGSNNMLMYLAALSNVPRNLYEAASIDGANGWQSFWNITWPQLAPTTFFIIIMHTIGGLQGGFDMARVMTQGGPAGSTTTLAYYLYERGFTDFKLGLASAIAWTMFAMIFVLTIINWRYGNKMVND
jgi:multiple sugar transport system permease protein